MAQSDIRPMLARTDVKIGYALTKYGPLAASTRQRFLQFRAALERASLHIEPMPLLPNAYLLKHFAGEGYSAVDALRCYGKRVATLLSRPKPDFLWIQYDALPFVPFLVEHRLYPTGVPRIYDFDDAIFSRYSSHETPFVRTIAGRKIEKLLSEADLAVCGNAYLGDYASRFCRRTEIFPTVLDTARFTPRPGGSRSDPVVIGWIGSPSTWDYVRPLFPVLERLQREHNVRVRAVGSWIRAEQRPDFDFVEWSEENEVAMIQSMDIGIMPLPDSAWAQGKCGYKLIQYMSCGIPVVASPVGANREIVDDELSGFFANDLDEWDARLKALIGSEERRRSMGAAGRARVVKDYSLAAHADRLAGSIREIVDAGREPPR